MQLVGKWVESGEAGEVAKWHIPQGPAGRHEELGFYLIAKRSPWKVTSLEDL